MTDQIRNKKRVKSILMLASLFAAIAALSGVIYAVDISPAVGAQAAETLRGWVGDPAVAFMEDTYFSLQDAVTQWQYSIGWIKPSSPWASTPVPPTISTPSASLQASRPGKERRALMAPSLLATSTMSPLATPTPTQAPPWPPKDVPSSAHLVGEGHWTPYIQNSQGVPVAYRTFLQPDPSRPYAIVSVVAFNLKTTRLGFVLGSSEPKSAVPLARTGAIPASDRGPQVLLATFNGGFKARHGDFGAMSNGTVVIPPTVGLGTVAIYADGSVQIGAWGTDLSPSASMVAWRQNGPLIVHNGQINPHTSDPAPQDWGYTVKGKIAVWRSSLGLSQDGTTLYYAAGPSLTLSSLAEVMHTLEVQDAMQLDINNYWVHFDRIEFKGGKPIPVPLMDGMKDGTGRYLWKYTRDYFYVTVKKGLGKPVSSQGGLSASG